MNMTRMSSANMGRQGGEERGELGAAARRPKIQKGHVAKMSGLNTEEPLGEGQPGPWRVQGRGPGM